MEDVLIGKEFPQNCGDTLKVLRKDLNHKYRYVCDFIKHPYTISALKDEILKGRVNNPKIIDDFFFLNEFPQNCGDTLKVIDKVKSKDNKTWYKIQFQKYPFEKVVSPVEIKRGSVFNPRIEEEEFINKIWPQKCGDSLKIIEKSDKRQGNNYLWKCEFIKYPYIIYAEKRNIQKGELLNKNFPYLEKDSFITFLKDNFKDKKPTLQELSIIFDKHPTTIGHYINIYNLFEYIDYYPEGSYKEQDLRDYIFSLNSNTLKKSTWKELNGKEIDIYIPSLKLGFEFNGNYWHSELYKEQNYHQEKSILAQEKGISLIHIFEYEWNDFRQQKILKSLIKSKIGLFNKKIYARKCEIKELDYKVYSQFCNENHLQGEAGAKVKLGLFFENELVQIMSFSVPRFADKYEWEIIREASKLDYIILGGKEKLWKYFLKKYNPKNCISYCDFSKFTGNSYLKLGFNLERLNKPGFVWWDSKLNITYWRSPYKHKEMKEKYIRIFDAGQLVFVWKDINKI